MARKRLRALSAIEVWGRPVGVPGEEWAPHAARSIYRNGHQARRYTDQFQILLSWLLLGFGVMRLEGSAS